jgi:hypothetical protein
MMMTKGVYDFMVENHNNKRNVENGIYREDHIYEGSKGLVHMEKWRFLDVELSKLEKQKKVQSQETINNEIIKQWEAAKVADVKAAPDKYFTEGDESTKSNNA